jgi:aspartate/glutamate racemase
MIEMKAPHVCILQTSFAKREDTVEFLKEKVPGVRVEFITDSTLLNDVRANSGPTQAIIDRMTLYAKAAEISGADLIVNSCSTVGEVVDIYEKVVGIPVMKVDLPMAQEAVSLGTKIALIATVETTLGPSQRLIEKEGAKRGKSMECTQYLQNAAWDALQAGNSHEHNRILMENIRQLDTMGYDAIVMAQVSMRALLPDLTDVKTPLLCSFFTGYGAVADKLNEIKEGRV